MLGPQVRLSTLLDVGSVYTEPGDPWLQRVFAICQARSGQTTLPRTATYFTDAAALRGPLGGPPTVILGPGDAALAHQTDEYCRVDDITDAVAIYQDLIRDWCELTP